MVNQVDHRTSVAFRPMPIVTREAMPEDFAEAGRITAEAYREFVPPDDDDWQRYLVRLADVGERASRTTVLVAIDEGRIIGCVTLELESRVRDGDGEAPLEPGEAHIRMLGVDPAARARGAGKTFITLHTTTKMLAARRMYERLGYVRDADRVFPNGFVLLGYRKELSGSMS